MAEIKTLQNNKSVLNDYFKTVKKRDGRLAVFNQSFITRAIMKAMAATGEGGEEDAIRVSGQTLIALRKKYPRDYVLGIEEIQDMAEESLILLDYAKTAKAYILYRQKRAEIRIERKEIPEKIKKMAEESKKYFRNSLGEFIYYRTYSRWIEEENRRETWIETINRYVNFMKENLGEKLTDAEYQEIKEAILEQKVMPSMRLLWGAGKAARKNNVCAYNCSFIAPAKIKDFAEIMFLLMNGAGVGFSVEHQTVNQFPQIQKQTGKSLQIHIIEDSKEGWGDALTLGLTAWFEGKDINFDFSKIRPEGSHLKTMGGKASGPEPLKNLLEFCRRKILSRQGKHLMPINVHDIICKIGEVVVMGGVRRSALISLSDLDDEMMKTAKMGQFYLAEPQRMLANNSVAYDEKPTADQFLEEWLNLIKSGAGERGIFNRSGLKIQVPERRWKTLEKDVATVGANPCGEIYLKSKEFCNLTEVVARAEDTEESLLNKIRIAVILGTYQSTFTDFRYLSEEWKKNCEEERLLGVSITGQWDCKVLRNAEIFHKLKEKAVEINKIYAERFGINPSAAITCVKPSGTVSQLVDASSGMHPRHSRYYIRRVRIAATDSLFQMLKEQRISYYPEVGQSMDSASTYVLEFPVKAPAGSIFRNDMSAIEQLEYWKLVKKNYTEHNPSVTISVGKDEWVKVGNWVYENWDIVGGLSFLPREDEDHVYKLAPYEEISEEKYNEMVAAFPEIDFSQIIAYEGEDETQGAKELACVSGVCEV
ncbi:ribonucleoside-triphosphate reductase [Candidatus Wolfebacteria bacterium]|nr:ribonucleoside-triphosphate reductase [Candidatus Wolfebacteria bacterium]